MRKMLSLETQNHHELLHHPCPLESRPCLRKHDTGVILYGANESGTPYGMEILFKEPSQA